MHAAQARRAPPRRDPKSERTRRRILQAAAAAFARDGYAVVTLNDIAERAELKAGSLYYHFASKESLVAEVLEAGVAGASAATREAVAALGPGAEPVTRLRVAIEAHLRYCLEAGDFAVANIRILSQVPEEIRRRHLRSQRRYGGFWRDLFDEAVATGTLRQDLDLSVVRMLVLGALNGSVEWYDPRGRQRPAAIADTLANMVFEGLLRPRS